MTEQRSQSDKPARKKGGPGRNSAEKNPTPLQRERQAKAFELSVEGRTTRSIGAELGISEHTAAAYIRIEERRRAEELKSRRDTVTARSIQAYERIKEKALKRAGVCDDIIEQIKTGSSDARINDHSLDAALKAQERIDKIQGVDAPTKLDLGMQLLQDALDGP
jgi:hypothetical protein